MCTDNRLDRITASRDVTQERQKHPVIKYLPHEENEILEDKFKGLLLKGMEVKDVEVDKIVRKPAVQEDISGVVIVTCKSKEDKAKVWKSKSKLKDIMAYANVYVEHDRHMTKLYGYDRMTMV